MIWQFVIYMLFILLIGATYIIHDAKAYSKLKERVDKLEEDLKASEFARRFGENKTKVYFEVCGFSCIREFVFKYVYRNRLKKVAMSAGYYQDNYNVSLSNLVIVDENNYEAIIRIDCTPDISEWFRLDKRDNTIYGIPEPAKYAKKEEEVTAE